MKANLPKSYHAPKKEPQTEVLLTIGMIVKNEEATLEECLKALSPLRKAVASELIIADTGSTDRTVEIAEKYADKLLHFTWCNDFAAARNTTIQAMNGLWYMYLDADEIFDDSILEIAHFFESGAYKEYETATYIQRNYDNFQHSSYSDYRAMRMRRRDERLWFNGMIHEQIPATEPVYQIEAVAHHDGYITLHVGNLVRHKAVRNRPLLEKELEKNPHSPRLYRHLADCYLMTIPEQWEQKEQCLQAGVKEEKNSNEGRYGGSLELELARFYKATQRADELRGVLDAWFSQPHQTMMADCEMYYLAGQQDFHLKRYQEAIDSFEKFFELYKRYLAHEFGLTVNMVIIVNATPSGLAKAQAMMGVCCARLGRFEEAREWMRRADPGKTLSQNGNPLLLEQLAEYLTAAEDVELLEETYQSFYELDPKFTGQLLFCIEKFFPAKSDKKERLYAALARQQNDDPVTALARLHMEEDGPEQREKDFETILRNEEALENDIFAEAVYAALEKPGMAERFFEKVRWEKAPVMCALMQRWHMRFARRAYRYLCSCAPSDDVRVLYWRIQLAENTVTADNDFTHDEWWEMLEKYAGEGARYCEMVYQPALWSDQGSEHLPAADSYLFCLQQALEKKRENDGAGYLRYLRLGLHRYEKMKATTEYLLKIFQDEMKAEERDRTTQMDEMEQLKKQIKQNIRQLIYQNKKEEAAQLLERYGQIAPCDPDAAMLERERQGTKTVSLRAYRRLCGQAQQLLQTARRKDDGLWAQGRAQSAELAEALNQALSALEDEDLLYQALALCEMFKKQNADGLEEKAYGLAQRIKTGVRKSVHVLFLAELKEKWDAQQSVYEAFAQREDCETVVVRTPYIREKKENGTIERRAIYHDYLTPMGVPSYDYRDYDAAAQAPDVTFMSQPYETNTPSCFWPENLSQHTRIVYINYFLVQGYKNKNWHDFQLDIFTYAWKIACQSAQFGDLVLSRWPDYENKLLLSGSPKLDLAFQWKAEKKEALLETSGWGEKLRGRKAVLWNTHYSSESWPDYAEELIAYFQKHTELALIWRPHPLTEMTLMYYKNLAALYKDLKETVSQAENMILDMNASCKEAFCLSDAMLTEWSSLMTQYLVMDKPTYYIYNPKDKNAQVILPKSYRERVCVLPNDWMESGGEGMFSFLDRLSAGAEDPKKDRRHEVLREYLPMADGKAGLRICDEVIAALRKEENL